MCVSLTRVWFVLMLFTDLKEDLHFFHTGTSLLPNGDLVTSGGRVIAVSATADSLEQAVKLAYRGVSMVEFDDMFYRRDIAHRSVSYSHLRSGITLINISGLSSNSLDVLLHWLITCKYRLVCRINDFVLCFVPFHVSVLYLDVVNESKFCYKQHSFVTADHWTVHLTQQP
jgi:hypothetical protein